MWEVLASGVAVEDCAYGSIEDVRSAYGCGSEQQATKKKKLPNTLCKPT